MKGFSFSQRLKRLPPYLFAQIDRQKSFLKSKGVILIDLSIGDPDILAPKRVVEILYKSAKTKQNQKYALDQGKPALRLAIKKWFKKRFGVSLDEDKEILPLIGSKEGLAHFPLGFVNKGDYIIVPSPGYPGYRGAATLVEAKIYELPLLEGDNFLPCLDRVPLSVRNKAKLMYLNYPNNPTTALVDKNFLKGLVNWCSKYGIIIAYDNAYSEIYFDKKPPSILEIKGAKEVACEFHSLSKTFCMTGFRIGWACGNKKLITGLLKVKTNVDSGIFGAIQDAAVYALEKEGDFVKNLRRIIRERRDLFVKGLQKNNWPKIYAESTFYVWVKISEKFSSSLEFSKYLLKEKNIVATPGVGFGRHGEGFIRFSLTLDKYTLKKTIELLNF
jgi:LL-diaminopimelate aminotransferase